MYIQNFEAEYKRSYPLYKTVRLSYRNLDKIRECATKYMHTIDEIDIAEVRAIREAKL
jgi:hypothetical protein